MSKLSTTNRKSIVKGLQLVRRFHDYQRKVLLYRPKPAHKLAEVHEIIRDTIEVCHQTIIGLMAVMDEMNARAEGIDPELLAEMNRTFNYEMEAAGDIMDHLKAKPGMVVFINDPVENPREQEPRWLGSH